MEGSWSNGKAARGIALAPLAILVVAMGAVACGDGSAEPSGPTVTLRVTRDFGRDVLSARGRAPLDGHRTVLRLLRAHTEVETVEGGWVAVIDGREQKRDAGWPRDETLWVLNVNGIESDTPPPDYRLHGGDVVQWDLRDWYATLDVRATVGAFPETFTRGVFGRRFPVTVVCAQPSSDACGRVKRALEAAGVDPNGAPPQGRRPDGGLPQRARILVGPWKRWHRRVWPRRVDRGPRYSGVFARFTADGSSMRMLDWNTRVIRTGGAGTGLVAAMRPTEEDLLWLVTGTDDEGVELAARALNRRTLRDAFAVAVTADGVEKLPLEP